MPLPEDDTDQLIAQTQALIVEHKLQMRESAQHIVRIGQNLTVLLGYKQLSIPARIPNARRCVGPTRAK